MKKNKHEFRKRITSPLTFVDLFSGAGGFTLGFEKAGFKNIFSIDVDRTFCKTYRKNFPQHVLIEKDISKLTAWEVRKIVGGKKVDVVVGGPPCQGFSIAGNIGRRFINDPRNHLFNEYVRIVGILQPEVFVMENVAKLYTHRAGRTRAEIISSFEKLGYKVRCEVLNAVNYGVPQNRRRVIFIGSKNPDLISFPEKHCGVKTVGDAIRDLPKLKSGEESFGIFNHKAMRHTEQMLGKMFYVKDGGNRSDIPIKLRPKTGDARKYIRYNSKQPAVTVTGDMRKVFHYSQNRALTVRELARLQSFEDVFVFEGSLISQQQQVGNSVPPLMASAIAKKIKKSLSKKKQNEQQKKNFQK